MKLSFNDSMTTHFAMMLKNPDMSPSKPTLYIKFEVGFKGGYITRPNTFQ